MTAGVIVGLTAAPASATVVSFPGTPIALNVSTPAAEAVYTLNEVVPIAFTTNDDAAVFSVETFVDGASVLFREFFPFDCDTNDVCVDPELINTATAGPHTISWTVTDMQLNSYSASVTYYVDDPNDPDEDDDGLYDEIDVQPFVFSDAFDTGQGIFGQVLDRANLNVTVRLPDPPLTGADFVYAAASGGAGPRATIEMCGEPQARTKFSAGDTGLLSCGSVIVHAIAGEPQIELGDGTTVLTLPTGAAVEITNTGGGLFTVDNIGTVDIQVVVDGVQGTVPAGEVQTVSAWDFQGFTTPVDNPETLNVVKAGQSVPLRWRLLGPGGTPVTTLTTATVTAKSLDCGMGTSSDQIEEVGAGSSGLLNLGSGYYQFTWKSPRGYANTCKTLYLDLGEGVTHRALFRLTR